MLLQEEQFVPAALLECIQLSPELQVVQTVLRELIPLLRGKARVWVVQKEVIARLQDSLSLRALVQEALMLCSALLSVRHVHLGSIKHCWGRVHA